MRLGTFRHRIEIQESDPDRGTQGSLVENFLTVATRWGSIREDAGQKFTVNLRHFDGLIPTGVNVGDDAGNPVKVNRLKHNNTVLNIEDVLDVSSGKERYTRLICVRDDETFV